MEMGDLEGVVDRAHCAVGLELEQSTPIKLARAHGVAVILVPNQRMPARRALVEGVETIALRASLSPTERQDFVGHELGHLFLRREGIAQDTDEVEGWCDYISAAIVARRRFFAKEADSNFSQLAARFKTTETLVALRYSEVLGEPVAVVAPSRVRARGDGWPDEHTLRTWSRRGHPGTRRVKLEDGRGRTAIVADPSFVVW